MSEISRLGVIGAGTMGHGIAQIAALSGLDVVLCDVQPTALEKAVKTIQASLDKLITKGKLSIENQQAALARLRTSTDLAMLAECDLVIEAATENEAIKIKILQQLDGIVRDTALLATNTSSISITQLAAQTKHPERLIGMHFFNPVPLMSLVELINGLQTSEATHQQVKALAERMGKTPISVKNAPGFVVNRILIPMINEAFFVLSEGLASAEDIDQGMKLGCNQPIGPLALADLIGLDVCLAVMNVYFHEFSDSKYRPCPLLKEMVAAGRLGRKTGRGVYVYNA